MDLNALKRRREASRTSRRRRGVTIALASALVVLVLVMGVFSVASLSRTVARDSSRIHALDEVLKSVTIIRAQLGFGIVLADLDGSTSIDASDAVRVATDDVAASLRDLDRSVTFIDENLSGLDAETTSALSAFNATVTQLQLDGPETEDATSEMITTFDRAYDRAIELVAAERDSALEDVATADEDLSRIGTLVNFLVAFVVPTAAFGIYRALTKPETELLLSDAQIVRDTVLRALKRDLLVREIDELGLAMADVPTPEHIGLTPSDRITAMRRIILSLDRAHETTFSSVPLAAAIETAASRASGDASITIDCDKELSVWSDPDALDALLTSVLADCRASGANQISFTAVGTDESACIRIAKNGMLRSPAEVRLLSKQGTIAERISLLGGPQTSVVAALHLAEDLGGSFDLTEVGDQQSFVIELPIAVATSKKSRALVFRDA